MCHKSLKKRGVKIHQAKSGCREELDRIRKSKSVAGRLQESNHSEPSSKTKPNEMTSNNETHVTGKKKKRKAEMKPRYRMQLRVCLEYIKEEIISKKRRKSEE